MEKLRSKRYWISGLVLGIGIICMSRFLPHPPNFTPLVSTVVFGAALFSKRFFQFIIPIAGLWISDLVLNNIFFSAYFDGLVFFSEAFLWSAGALILIALLMTRFLANLSAGRVISGAIGGSLIFFVVTNFGAWLSTPQLYTQDLSGLITSYIAALPFLASELSGSLFYTFVLFGTYYLVDRSSLDFLPQLSKG